MTNTKYVECGFDICRKRLIDFCFKSSEDGQYYCDEICAERAILQTQKQDRCTWH